MNVKNDKDENYRDFDNKNLEVNKITKVVNGKNTKIITNNDYMKYEIASELGLLDKVKEFGWAELTAKEAGQIVGILTSINRKRKKKEYR